VKQSKLGVYKALGSDGFELCQPVNDEDYERIDVEIGGRSVRSSWRPIPVRLIREDEGKALVISDSPWLGYGPLIFRPSVVKALGLLLQEYGELLPLMCQETDLVIYNPTLVIDALDEEASSLMRFDDGRIMLIQNYVFRSDIVGENDIFTIPSERVSPTFFSHRFVDLWIASGLRGLEFKQVWRPQK
jgi:hypothetical protein